MISGSFIPETVAPREPSGADILFLFKNREVLISRDGSEIRFPLVADLEDFIDQKTVRCVGTIGDTLCFAAPWDGEPPQGNMQFENLRTVFFDSRELWRPAMSTAVLVVDWDANHAFCGRCGTATESDDKEWCRKCPSCGFSVYPRISPAIIVAILKEGKILLAHNKRFTTPVYSLIAGFAEPGEPLEDTVRREVMEETGLQVKNIRYFSSQSWPFPDSLMIGFIADYHSGEIALNDELADAGWYTPDHMPTIPGHGTVSRSIIDWYLDTRGDAVLPSETVHRG